MHKALRRAGGLRSTRSTGTGGEMADAADLGSAAARHAGSSPAPCTSKYLRVDLDVSGAWDEPVVCTSVCTTLQEPELQAAIDRLTRALARADDETIGDLVAERRALREELRVLRETSADVVRLDDQRATRPRGT